ncbi:Protein PBDC1 [Wickerhamiella sorbophila]|uniref:Protein PBDC1 homolog n=1 Tax=Wickerhamiella sorbophila TaxID=45607 RepID=A0A2T0FP87_9ASCO|nr:Protein PBDC1 [Wickerhamiella sorbophila]PRT56800.1 Protein PBDC1 [Wickerhamiella sorbophila]
MSKTFNAEEAENLEDIEKQFAVKAVEQAQTYWGLLEKVPGSKLKLTSDDDVIYDHLLREFPEFHEGGIWSKVIDEDMMKTKSGKERWRNFCNVYEKIIDDYNFGTLLRLDPAGEYNEKNTMFALRIQFYAIEILRNKRGMNNWVAAKSS